MHKFGYSAAAVCVALCAYAASAFDADGWYEHWQTPDFELRFNFSRGEDTVLHTQNADIICADGRRSNNLSEEEVNTIFSPLWDAINELSEENYHGLPPDDARVTDPKRQKQLYHLRYADPNYGTQLNNYYDFSDNEKLLKKLRENASKLCDKKPKS